MNAIPAQLLMAQVHWWHDQKVWQQLMAINEHYYEKQQTNPHPLIDTKECQYYLTRLLAESFLPEDALASSIATCNVNIIIKISWFWSQWGSNMHNETIRFLVILAIVFWSFLTLVAVIINTSIEWVSEQVASQFHLGTTAEIWQSFKFISPSLVSLKFIICLLCPWGSVPIMLLSDSAS